MKEHRNNPYLPMLRHAPASAALFSLLKGGPFDVGERPVHRFDATDMAEPVRFKTEDWVFVQDTANDFLLEATKETSPPRKK